MSAYVMTKRIKQVLGVGQQSPFALLLRRMLNSSVSEQELPR